MGCKIATLASESIPSGPSPENPVLSQPPRLDGWTGSRMEIWQTSMCTHNRKSLEQESRGSIQIRPVSLLGLRTVESTAARTAGMHRMRLHKQGVSQLRRRTQISFECKEGDMDKSFVFRQGERGQRRLRFIGYHSLKSCRSVLFSLFVCYTAAHAQMRTKTTTTHTHRYAHRRTNRHTNRHAHRHTQTHATHAHTRRHTQ